MPSAAATRNESAGTEHHDDPSIRLVVAALCLDDGLRERPEMASAKWT